MAWRDARPAAVTTGPARPGHRPGETPKGGPGSGQGRLLRASFVAAIDREIDHAAVHSAGRLLKWPVKVDHQGMNPPGEQLVRDYLNRLAVAARGRLGHTDRQGLLERTRLHIEHEFGGLRDASAEQVTRALAAMGEPLALVEQERARIAANKASLDAGIGGLFGGRKSSVVKKLRPAQGAAAGAEAGGHANRSEEH